jgi:5-hydroxyisourate hydrolase-like protein (transthyretin family)
VVTDSDGRSGPLLAGDAFTAGRYLLTFDLSDYFKRADNTLPENFYRKLSMEFEVTDATVPHHIPLQCTPWTQACSVLPG